MNIGIFALASPGCFDNPIRFKRAIKNIEKYNNNIFLGSCVLSSDFYRTDSIIKRASDFNDLVNKKYDILMSAIGGSNTNSVLHLIDYKAIKKYKPIICGFSDTTVLLLAVIRKCKNVRVMYGPALLPTFGDWENEFIEETYNSLFDSISKNKKISMPKAWTDQKLNWNDFEKKREVKINKWNFKKVNNKSVIKGRLIGGNLNSIIGTYGSEYGLKIKKGDILLIEDSCKTAELVEKNLSFLQVNKIFNKCSAILLAKHECFDDQETKRKPIDILNEILDAAKINIPIVWDVDFCHTKPLVVLELNSKIKIDFDNKTIERN